MPRLAPDGGVMRPWIVCKRVERPGQFREQALVPVLTFAATMKRVGQELAFAVEIDASENRLSASENSRTPEASAGTSVRLFQRDSHSLTIALKASGFSMLQTCAPGSTNLRAPPGTRPAISCMTAEGEAAS
jgi:hypothetical protein